MQPYLHPYNNFYSRLWPLKQTFIWNVTHHPCFAGRKWAPWTNWSCVTSQECSWARSSEKKILSSLVKNKTEQPRRAGQLSSGSCMPCMLTCSRDRKALGGEDSGGNGILNYSSLPWLAGFSAVNHQDLRQSRGKHSQDQPYLACLPSQKCEFYTVLALPINIAMWERK